MVSDMEVGSGYFDRFNLRHIRAEEGSVLRPTAAEHDRVAAPCRFARPSAGYRKGTILRRSAGYPKTLKCDNASGVQPLYQLEGLPRSLRKLRTLRGTVVVSRLARRELARFGKRGATRVRHYAARLAALDFARH